MLNDPYCDYCMDTHGAVLNDREHFFCLCDRVQNVWSSIKLILYRLLPCNPAQEVTDLDIITLNFPPNVNDAVLVWLVERYMEEVWQVIYRNKAAAMDKGRLFGYLKFKNRSDQLGARSSLNIPELEN